MHSIMNENIIFSQPFFLVFMAKFSVRVEVYFYFDFCCFQGQISWIPSFGICFIYLSLMSKNDKNKGKLKFDLVSNQAHSKFHITRVKRKLGNILVNANLQCIYHVTKAVQVIGGTCYSW